MKVIDEEEEEIEVEDGAWIYYLEKEDILVFMTTGYTSLLHCASKFMKLNVSKLSWVKATGQLVAERVTSEQLLRMMPLSQNPELRELLTSEEKGVDG